MLNLRKNSLWLAFLFLHLQACTTSSFRISNSTKNRVELHVTADRIIMECGDVSDENDLYMFLIYILDETNTVITVSQGNTMDKEPCDDRIRNISKILNNGRSIYIAGVGDLRDKRSQTTTKYMFPKHGTFYGNSRDLQFTVISNEKGQCYSAHMGMRKPCPDSPFPISAYPD